MVYVDSDGTIHQNRPGGLHRITDVFWGAVNFVTNFFWSLIGLDRASVTSNSRSGGGGPNGPGNGPPRPPRRMGGITTIQDCSMPGGG